MLSIKSHFSVQVVQCDLLLKVMWMVVTIINLHVPLENSQLCKQIFLKIVVLSLLRYLSSALYTCVQCSPLIYKKKTKTNFMHSQKHNYNNIVYVLISIYFLFPLITLDEQSIVLSKANSCTLDHILSSLVLLAHYSLQMNILHYFYLKKI